MKKLVFKYLSKQVQSKINNIQNKCKEKKHYLQHYRNNITADKAQYQDLAAKDDIDDKTPYLEMLDWAIENKKVFNIAVTGTYGSGKSSILRTYESQRTHNHYLNISLASFYNNRENIEAKESNEEQREGNDKENVSSISDLESMQIEKSILQQLFYKVKPSKIPYTRFRKLNNIKLFSIILSVGLIVISGALTTVYFAPNSIVVVKSNLEQLKSLLGLNKVVDIGAIILVCLLLGELIIGIKYFKSRIKLSKVTLEKAEIELDNQSNDSVFNRYLDEILYFFEATRYNVVFIEDLDRFNDTKIFIKLRELNNLINNAEQIKQRVVFIYAIKDDMFRDKERTKFFDALIPVIPVINATNSGDQLLEKIKNKELWKDITEHYINGVAVYIDDMRILNNIYNEYMLYKQVLTDVSLKSQQILSLIIYKNLYPKDFSELQFNKGLVHKAFSDKTQVVKKIVREVATKRQALEQKIEQAKEEVLSTEREVKVAFLYNTLDRNERITNIYTDKYYSIDEIMKDNFDLKLLDRDFDVIYVDGYSSKRESSSMQIANERAKTDRTYIERLEDTKLKHDAQQQVLKRKIEQLYEEEKSIKAYKLAELIKRYGVSEVLCEQICDEKPIVYLLRNGYIDETYPNYLTYFYPNSLTQNDMNFILAIRNYEAVEFDYQLTKYGRIVEKLSVYEFEQEEVLNFYLLDYLIEYKEQYSQQLQAILKQLSNGSSRSIDFIEQFIEVTKHEKEFIKMICHTWRGIGKYVFIESNYSIYRQDNYLYKILKYADLEDIYQINSHSVIVNYILQKNNFLQFVDSIKVGKVKEIIKKLNILFRDVEFIGVRPEIVDFILENSYYEINIIMIQRVLAYKNIADISILNTAHYTTIMNSGYNPLINYVQENLQYYMDEVCLQIDSNVNEEEDRIIELLNSSGLSKETKEGFIEKEVFELDEISVVSDSLWDCIFENLKVKVSWKNIYTYYEQTKEINEVLNNYLERPEVYLELSRHKFIPYAEENEKELWHNFMKELIESQSDIGMFRKVVDSMIFIYTDFLIDEIEDEEKVDILIAKNKFKFTKTLFSKLKQIMPNKHIDLVEKYPTEYIQIQDELNLSNDDIYKILKLSCFSFEDIEKILAKIKKEEMDEDLVVEVYEKLITSSERIRITPELYKQLWEKLAQDQKVYLLVNQLLNLPHDTIKICLRGLGGEYEKITLPRQRAKLIDSQIHLRLAEGLKEHEYISSFKRTEDARRHRGSRKIIQINTKASA